MNYTPQMIDAILKSRGRQMGPAVDTSSSKIIAGLSAQDMARQKAAEDIQKGIDLRSLGLANQKELAEQRMKQQGEQFAGNLGFAKRKFTEGSAFDKERFGKELEFDKYRFGQNLGLAKEEMDYMSKASDWATGISALGLGLAGLEKYKGRQRLKERQNAIFNLQDRMKKRGDLQGEYFTTLLQVMGGY